MYGIVVTVTEMFQYVTGAFFKLTQKNLGAEMKNYFDDDTNTAEDLVGPVAKALAASALSDIDRMRLYCCFDSTKHFIDQHLELLRVYGWAAKTGYKLDAVSNLAKTCFAGMKNFQMEKDVQVASDEMLTHYESLRIRPVELQAQNVPTHLFN